SAPTPRRRARRAGADSPVESTDGLDHAVELPARQLRVHGERQHLAGRPLRRRQATRPVAQMAEAGLQVQRDGIIDRAPDALALEARLQLVPALDAQRVLVIDV